MDQYWTTVALLGLNDGNLPVHRGTRQKRYQSVEKMLDLLDVVKRIGPKFPTDAMYLDKYDSEWDDDMTYLYVEHSRYKDFTIYCGLSSFAILYNHNFWFHNVGMKGAAKIFMGMMFFMSTQMYYKYRK